MRIVTLTSPYGQRDRRNDAPQCGSASAVKENHTFPDIAGGSRINIPAASDACMSITARTLLVLKIPLGSTDKSIPPEEMANIRA